MDELNSSELGTKEYWQNAYTKEIHNFEEHGDPGDVWFGEDAAIRVINWISKRGFPSDTSIIDLGCGNGYTLTELATLGFTNLLGIDYCEEAITLAKKISETQYPNIVYKVYDITISDTNELDKKFGIIHDKGTYDAISLNPNNSKLHRELYLKKVTEMLEDDGVFIITSCNWTEDELKQHFNEKLKVNCVIPTPQFKFGGKVGNVVSSVVFNKK